MVVVTEVHMMVVMATERKSSMKAVMRQATAVITVATEAMVETQEVTAVD